MGPGSRSKKSRAGTRSLTSRTVDTQVSSAAGHASTDTTFFNQYRWWIIGAILLGILLVISFGLIDLWVAAHGPLGDVIAAASAEGDAVIAAGTVIGVIVALRQSRPQIAEIEEAKVPSHVPQGPPTQGTTTSSLPKAKKEHDLDRDSSPVHTR